MFDDDGLGQVELDPRRWWEETKRLFRNEADKVRAFVAAVGAFDAELAKLPAIRARIAALRDKHPYMGPYAPGRSPFEQMVAALVEAERRLSAKGAGLLADVRELMRRASQGRVEAQGMASTLGRGIGDLGAWWLWVGIGAGAVIATGAIIGWIERSRALQKQTQAAEDVLARLGRGELTAKQATDLLQAMTPKSPLIDISPEAVMAGVAVIGAFVVLPRLLGGATRRAD